MITSFQMRAARALLGIDQKTLAELAGVSLPTIQRMEASTGNVRGVVETLIKVVDAFDRAGVELIGEHARSDERRARRSPEGAGAAAPRGSMIALIVLGMSCASSHAALHDAPELQRSTLRA